MSSDIKKGLLTSLKEALKTHANYLEADKKFNAANQVLLEADKLKSKAFDDLLNRYDEIENDGLARDGFILIKVDGKLFKVWRDGRSIEFAPFGSLVIE